MKYLIYREHEYHWCCNLEDLMNDDDEDEIFTQFKKDATRFTDIKQLRLKISYYNNILCPKFGFDKVKIVTVKR